MVAMLDDINKLSDVNFFCFVSNMAVIPCYLDACDVIAAMLDLNTNIGFCFIYAIQYGTD